MNNIEHDYLKLLYDVFKNGELKQGRNGKTRSVFGRQIRHNMSEGFPLLTTKKMYWKGIVTELLWFLRGDTNIKFLVDNNCHIWDGDAYKNYINNPAYKAESVADLMSSQAGQLVRCSTQEEFVEKIKTDDEFAKKWGELGPIYGKQWRGWRNGVGIETNLPHPDGGGRKLKEGDLIMQGFTMYYCTLGLPPSSYDSNNASLVLNLFVWCDRTKALYQLYKQRIR